MTRTLTTRLLLTVVLTALATPLPPLTAQHAAAAADRRTDLAVAPPESVGVSSERLKRLDAGTWFWIDAVADFAFIGMMQHSNLRTAGEVHALSRNIVYQAIVGQ